MDNILDRLVKDDKTLVKNVLDKYRKYDCRTVGYY